MRNPKDADQQRTDIIIFNKPFDVLCQFTDNSPAGDQSAEGMTRLLLADYIDAPGYYAAGRLDRDSEGLLILTCNGKLQSRISHPQHKMPKTYLAQVEGTVTDEALQQLRQGVQLKDGRTRPAQAESSSEPDWLWPRNPPIRERKSIPTSWLSLTLMEGKNRQVRRMTAAVGFPTLRLIRVAVGRWSVLGLQPGQWRYDIRSTEK